MKRTLGLLIALTVISTFTLAEGGACGLFFHGTLHAEPDSGCWIFVADDGNTYQPIGGSEAYYSEGLTGTLAGTPAGQAGYCSAGPLLSVCGFEPDKKVTLAGTLQFDPSPQSGCWILISGNRAYEPLSISNSFYRSGVKVRVTGVLRPDLKTACMAGDVVEVLEWDFIKRDRSEMVAEHTASCISAYSRCLKICQENVCYVSCETLLEACLHAP